MTYEVILKYKFKKLLNSMAKLAFKMLNINMEINFKPPVIFY